MRKNNKTTNVPRGTINKGTNKMKTITITLNKEQERLLLNRVQVSTWRIPLTLRKYLTKDIKKPSEWTRRQITRAKELDQQSENEHKEVIEIIDQIEKQLKLNQ